MVYPKERKRLREKKNPMVFLDVSVDEVSIGTMVFKLFEDVAPAYAENFRALCTGEKGDGAITSLPLHYKGSYFIDLEQRSSYVKGGDFFNWKGICGESIYGMDFPNDVPKPRLGCNERGLLCMNVGDQYTLGSHFVITLEPDESLDGLHVVFGKLVKGFATLGEIAREMFRSRVQVSNCGEYDGDEIDGDETEEVLTNARETTKISKFPVYLDVHFFGQKIERMVFELFHDIAPLAAENFRALCTGEKGQSPKTGRCLCYMDSYFHMKKGSSYVKGGTLRYRTDEGVESIYRPNAHVAERNDLKHDKGGLLSMSRRDLNASCGSFIITLRADPRLDSSHVVFGKLVEGLDTLPDLEEFCFMTPIEIIHCGVSYNARDIPRGVIVRPFPSLRVGEDQDEEFGRVTEELW